MALSKIDTAAIAADAVTNTKIDASLGKVLQVVEATSSSQVNISTTTFSDVLTANITPSSTSSKILVMGVASGYQNQVGSATSNYMGLFRDSTEIHVQRQTQYDTGASTEHQISFALQKLDSPATTSQITYRMKAKRDSTTYAIRLNYSSGNTAGIGLVLMEIEG